MYQASKDRGWKFPVKVDKVTGRIMMSEDEEDIHEAVLIIVKTAKKERKMRPQFGSNVHRYVFEENVSNTLILLEEEVRNAILNWERRVSNVNVKAYVNEENSERVMIDLHYEITSTRREYNRTISLDF